MKRRRIRKAYADRLAEAEQELAARLTGTRLPKRKAGALERARSRLGGTEEETPFAETDMEEYELMEDDSE